MGPPSLVTPTLLPFRSYCHFLFCPGSQLAGLMPIVYLLVFFSSMGQNMESSFSFFRCLQTKQRQTNIFTTTGLGCHPLFFQSIPNLAAREPLKVMSCHSSKLYPVRPGFPLWLHSLILSPCSHCSSHGGHVADPWTFHPWSHLQTVVFALPSACNSYLPDTCRACSCTSLDFVQEPFSQGDSLMSSLKLYSGSKNMTLSKNSVFPGEPN